MHSPRGLRSKLRTFRFYKLGAVDAEDEKENDLRSITELLGSDNLRLCLKQSRKSRH